MNYWIIKSDPESYSWEQMKIDKSTFWDGIRNNAARLNLKKMNLDDICLFYLSNADKSIFGEVKVIKEAYLDPNDPENKWFNVDVQFQKEYKRPISLSQIKEIKELSIMAIIKNTRLSVLPLTSEEYKFIFNFCNQD